MAFWWQQNILETTPPGKYVFPLSFLLFKRTLELSEESRCCVLIFFFFCYCSLRQERRTLFTFHCWPVSSFCLLVGNEAKGRNGWRNSCDLYLLYKTTFQSGKTQEDCTPTQTHTKFPSRKETWLHFKHMFQLKQKHMRILHSNMAYGIVLRPDSVVESHLWPPSTCFKGCFLKN